MNPAQFLREVTHELKNVSFPTRDEVVKMTSLVIALSLLVALYVGGIDLLLARGIEWIVQ